MQFPGISVAEWRQMRDGGMRDLAWLLAVNAARQAAERVLASGRLREAATEDLVQEAALVAIDRASTLRDTGAQLVPWMGGVLRRLALRERTRSRRSLGRTVAPAELDATPWPERGEGDARTSTVPSVALTTAEVEAAAACVETGSLAAAARRLGISVGALRSRFAHARRRKAASPWLLVRSGVGSLVASSVASNGVLRVNLSAPLRRGWLRAHRAVGSAGALHVVGRSCP